MQRLKGHLQAFATRFRRLVIAAILLAAWLPAAAQSTNLNYTALWWNPAEAGWGLNVSHQGPGVFATLFTYDALGAPLWLVMSRGDVQADAITYSGDLFQTTGPAFNASPFTPIGAGNFTKVGTMSISFTASSSATLTYSLNAIPVAKSLRKQVFGTSAAGCQASTNFYVNRASLTNYQDLWWNPQESGWGMNITHQDNTLFATLFTYDTSGKPLWLVMSAGNKQADGSFSGDLYRTTGPAFNASPFTPMGAANLTKVGTMQLRFSDGETGTLAYTVNGSEVIKAITRQVLASSVPVCAMPSFAPKLLALIRGDDRIGYVDIDIGSFSGVQRKPGASIYAADYDPSTNAIVLASPLAASTQPYSFVDVVTGASSPGLDLPYQTSQRTAVKCEPKNSPRAGTCYYGFGGGLDGRVVIASGRDVVETVTLPDASLGRVPGKFAIIADTLVVMTLGPFGRLDVLHRLNLATTPRTWQAPISLPFKAIGIDARGSSVYVAGVYASLGYSIAIADAVTGSVKDLNLSLGFAGGVALSADTMFTSAVDRVKAYRLSDNAFLGDIALAGAQRLAYYGGYLFASSFEGRIYKINAATRATEAEIFVPQMRDGDLVVIAP